MKHDKIEKNVFLLIILALLVISVGGLVEWGPLLLDKRTIDERLAEQGTTAAAQQNAFAKTLGVRPYTPLELAGREIYVREGCYGCHTQMIRSLRGDVVRYGSYSLAVESKWDRPFQWGSKRTGPDLGREGTFGWTDQWQIDHLTNPQAVVEGSIMPRYSFLAKREIDLQRLTLVMNRMKTLKVPYTPEMLQNVEGDLKTQATPDLLPESKELLELVARYGKVRQAQANANSKFVSEMDALVAYLQVLGTMVDFDLFDQKDKKNYR